MTSLPIRIFIGYDPRQPIAYHVLCSSILSRASRPVAITPLLLHTLPIERVGLTEFTYARYLVPYLCNYEGRALFLDSDMLVLGDVAELFSLHNEEAVSVVHFDNGLFFERPSAMLFNCEQCRDLTPEYIDDEKNSPQSFDWAATVGDLPPEWNYLVGYSHLSEMKERIKLLHFTQGIPAYKECRDSEFASHWFEEKDEMLNHVSWLEIMGGSVHATPVLNRLKGK